MAEVTEKPSRIGQTARGILRSESTVIGIVLVALVGVFAILSKGYSATTRNIMNVIVQSSTRGMAAIGQAFVILTAGIDLSVGGIALLTMCASGLMMTRTTGFPAGPIGAMLILGMALGASSGLAVSRMNIPPLIATLGLWIIVRGVSLVVTGGYTISYLPTEVAFFGQGHIAGVPTPIIMFVVTCIIAYFVLNHTTFGRSIYAVGGNPVSAWLSGINVKNVQLSVYIVAGFCAALAGLITMARTMCASQASVAGLELDSIAAVVVGGVSLFGGRGSLIGVVIGVLIIGVINNGMSVLAVDPAYQEIVKGGIIYAAVAIDCVRRR